jgi:hypothetical protein
VCWGLLLIGPQCDALTIGAQRKLQNVPLLFSHFTPLNDYRKCLSFEAVSVPKYMSCSRTGGTEIHRVASFKIRPLYPLHPLYRSRFGCDDEEEIPNARTGNQTAVKLTEMLRITIRR